MKKVPIIIFLIIWTMIGGFISCQAIKIAGSFGIISIIFPIIGVIAIIFKIIPTKNKSEHDNVNFTEYNPQDHKINYCSNCGMKILEEKNFCPYCGKELTK